jgi:hypothetical protein
MKRSLVVLLAYGLWATVPLTLAVGCGGDDSADDDDHGEHDDHGDDHGHDGDAAPHDHEDADVDTPSGAKCPDGATLTYENFGKKFFADYCLSCHSSKVTGTARNGAPPDHNFDDLDHIALLTKHIDEMAAIGPTSPDASKRKMPPAGKKKPSDEDRTKLGQWIACEIPE